MMRRRQFLGKGLQSRMTSLIGLLTVAVLSVPTTARGGDAPTGKSSVTARIRVDADQPKWTISKYLTGSHFVYAFERDSLYRDERIAAWMRRSKVGVIRWPGGTAVQTYHWDKLNGIAFKADTWNPKYAAAPKHASEYMDLDEYIAYCKARQRLTPMPPPNKVICFHNRLSSIKIY